jgi:tRNA threonylcarbamoyladenosine biosynthesis protein TsaE
MQKSYVLNDLSSTAKLASAIAASIVPNFVVTLTGNLGAGKTTLTREILKAMGVKGSIKSPTFTLVEPYQVNGTKLFHFDLYRFNDPEEWFDAGFDEYFGWSEICFIEWAEKAQALIPKVDWSILININQDNIRNLTITTQSDIGEKCLKNLINSAVI